MDLDQLPDPTYPSVPDRRDSAALGYVIVPEGQPQAAYVRQALTTGRLSIVTDRGEFVHRVLASRQALTEISQQGWPQEPGERGPALLLVNLPIHNQLVATCTVLRSDEVSTATGDFEDGLLLRTGTGFVALRARGETGSYSISLAGQGNDQARLTVRLANSDGQALHDTYVQGDSVLRADGLARVDAGQQFELRVGPTDDTQGETVLTYERGKGLRYRDEFGNELTAGKDDVQLRRAGDHQTIRLSPAGIDLASATGAEAALLGNTLLKLVGELIDAVGLSSYQVIATGSPTKPGPLNLPAFQQIKSKLASALSKYVRLD